MRATTPSRTPRQDKVIHALALTAVALMMFISPMMLMMIGWNYDAPGGSGPMRFHPATYTVFLLYIVIALRDGNPLASLLGAFNSDSRLWLFLAAWIVLLYHALANQSLPAASLVDTFLLPLLILQIVVRLSPETQASMVRLIHIGFALNALLGIAEFGSGWRLTPYVAGGILITDDWRSTAFIGHPLGNALMTGCYTMILLLGGGALKGWHRPAMIGLQLVGMVAFGGRASLVLLMLAVLVTLARSALQFLAGAKLQLRHVVLLAFLLPALVGIAGALLELGFFDKFILRFTEDKGSANARIVMFELFRGFTIPELLFGPQQENLAHYVHIHRLEFGIESLWVAFILFYGILPSLLFFTGLLFYLFALSARCQGRAWLVIGYFFVVNSTFLGIAGKTIGFAMMCLFLLLLLPRRAPAPLALPLAAGRARFPARTAQC
ncbi:MAG TPA: VpsF family polysaccharide biosynthesis protein [Rhabdaerophilum sp.]|nr:VpsF family polysaccharide biosynthesis protein [Rhabdaerophilum sp.]